MFTFVTGIHKRLTFEQGEGRICTPCKHLLCPAHIMRMLCLCRECGHEACEVCVEISKERGKRTCCQGCVVTEYFPVGVPEQGTEGSKEQVITDHREVGPAGRHCAGSLNRVMMQKFGRVVHDLKAEPGYDATDESGTCHSHSSFF